MKTGFTCLYLVFALYLNNIRCVLHPENVTGMMKGPQLSQEDNMTDTIKGSQLPQEDNVTDTIKGPQLSQEDNVTDTIKGPQLSQEKANATDAEKDPQLPPEEDNVSDTKEGPTLSPEENVKATNTRPQLSWYLPKADTTTEISARLGYRYNGLDLLLCPWSYTCGEPGSPVPSNQKIPSTCCTGG